MDGSTAAFETEGAVPAKRIGTGRRDELGNLLDASIEDPESFGEWALGNEQYRIRSVAREGTCRLELDVTGDWPSQDQFAVITPIIKERSDVTPLVPDD